MKCRHCYTFLNESFIDLGFSPPSNAYLKEEDLINPEVYYPLKVMVCTNCWLIQTEDHTCKEQLFTDDYAYLSSVSTSWCEHARKYTSRIIEECELNNNSHVMEIASNDGYLLKNFLLADIPCLGIEPTKSTAKIAKSDGISVIEDFFGSKLALKLREKDILSDLIIANNVLAHVPDINDFTLGLKICLKQDGLITLEFPHAYELIANKQFDTIYHEHFSYLSATTVASIMAKNKLKIIKIEKLPTHGGSLRVYVAHDCDERKPDKSVNKIIDDENRFGLKSIDAYKSLQFHANNIKLSFLSFLIDAKKSNKIVAAYGAAAKGNTILNFSGVRSDLISYVFDESPSKIDKYLPGSHIQIIDSKEIWDMKIDYLIVFPWNIIDEVLYKYKEIAKNGTKFVTLIPELRIL